MRRVNGNPPLSGLAKFIVGTLCVMFVTIVIALVLIVFAFNDVQRLLQSGHTAAAREATKTSHEVSALLTSNKKLVLEVGDVHFLVQYVRSSQKKSHAATLAFLRELEQHIDATITADAAKIFRQVVAYDSHTLLPQIVKALHRP
jgi:predicted negative regulator of RcsB-dependent stress response